MEVILLKDDPWQKLRDFGAEEDTDMEEGETLIMFGFRRIPKADESHDDAATSPSEHEARTLTPEQEAGNMRAMYDPHNAIDASAWLGKDDEHE